MTPRADQAVERRIRRDWVDRLRAHDPGGTRARQAGQVVATMSAAIGAEWLFVHTTHVLQIDPGHGVPAATVALQHHGVLVVALMVGAVLALCGTMAAPMFETMGKRARNLALAPIPAAAGFALGLALAPHRIPGFIAIITVLTVGAYLRRFGPRGLFGGVFLFLGTFFGLFLYGAVTISAIGWLIVEICLAVVVTVALQLTVFRQRDDRALKRLRRSFGARSRSVAAVALALTSARPVGERERLVRVLRRRTLRFNETALMIDAYLARPGTLPDGLDPGSVHQRLFDAELAVTNMARFTVSLTAAGIPAEVRDLVQDGLFAVGEVNAASAYEVGTRMLEVSRSAPAEAEAVTRIIVHRFGDCLITFAQALTELREVGVGSPEAAPDRPQFAAATNLVGGFRPSSAAVSKTASELPREQALLARSGLAPNTRVAIQMGIAVTVALVLGDQLDQRRWYWAVIAAFVTFMGANNAGEQLRKGWFRVLGTVAGVLVGALLAHAVGKHVLVALAVIMVALFFGLYFMRSSYAWFVLAITIAVSQLYTELGTYSNDLLLLRLKETTLGVGVALLTVIFVLPLRTGQVVRVAAQEYLGVLRDLVQGAEAAFLGAGDPDQVRAAARRLDAAHQVLVTTLASRRVPLLRPPSSRILFANSLATSRNYARNLIADLSGSHTLSGVQAQHLQFAVATLSASIDELIAGLQGRTPGEYVRSSSVFEALGAELGLESTDPPALALRDLQHIDGALAVLADQFGLTVSALDEVPATKSAPGPSAIPR